MEKSEWKWVVLAMIILACMVFDSVMLESKRRKMVEVTAKYEKVITEQTKLINEYMRLIEDIRRMK